MSWYKDAIPKEYRRLEYIQSTGTQYIDTGVPLTSNSRVVMDCELTTVSGTQCFFCSRTEATTTDITSNTLFAIGSTYRKEYYGESKTATNSDGANKRIIIDNDKNRIEIGSAILSFSSVSDTVSPMNCYLMASTVLENGVISTFSNFAYMKLYSCQIYNNDILVRSFIPCQKKSDSTLGLYDTVSQSFYVNSGVGTFSFKELVVEPKMYVGVEKQVPNYTEQEKYLTVDTFSDFFDSAVGGIKWEVKPVGQVLNSVFIEPENQSPWFNSEYVYFLIMPKINFKGLNIFLSYNTEPAYGLISFSYNEVMKIKEVSGTSTDDVIVNLTNVKAGDKLKFWYVRIRGTDNEKVRFQLVTIETPKVEKEDGTYHIKPLSEKVGKIYGSFENSIKKVSKGYLGVNSLSKPCFVTGTQLGDLNIGETIEVAVATDWQNRFGESIIFKIADKNHNGYPDNCTTLITDKIIQFMPFDAAEPRYPGNSDIKKCGNPRYIYSNLLQWMNSDASMEMWYNPKYEYDWPPTAKYVAKNPYRSWAGFLAMLDPKFVVKLLMTTVVVKITDAYNSDYENSISKMFLPSVNEIGLNQLNYENEGTCLALFNDDTSRIAYATENAFAMTSGVIFSLADGAPWYTRTFSTYIKATGQWHTFTPNINTCGLRPLCNLSNDTFVSAKPNANGHYTLL